MVKYSSREKDSSTYLRPPPLPHTPFPPPPLEYVNHKVYRVPGIFSSRPNQVPSPTSECCSSPFGSKGEDTLACWGGGGGPIPTKEQTFWYSMYNIIPLRYECSAGFPSNISQYLIHRRRVKGCMSCHLSIYLYGILGSIVAAKNLSSLTNLIIVLQNPFKKNAIDFDPVPRVGKVVYV